VIDHLSLPVADLERSRRFYDAALAPLGARRMLDLEEADYTASGYGMREGEPAFWVGTGTRPGAAAPVPPEGLHVAFQAPDRAAVDAFHAAAVAAGGLDNGGPGLRPQYHPNYYAAFAIDPDGHHVEAVCHRPA